MATPAARLLIVDDETAVLKLAQKALAEGQYDIRTATDGAEGFLLARESIPDLVITDVTMPRMDGWTMVKHLRANPKLALVPVIFLTARSRTEDFIQGFRLGADDYLDKTTSFWELPDRVTRALARRQELEKVIHPPASPTSGLSGRCDQIGLASLLTVLEMGRRSGILRLHRTEPAEAGVLYMVSGRVHRADLEPRRDLRNREAVYAMLGWSEGTFDFAPSPLRVADDVGFTTTQLLIEGARRIDEPRAG